MGPVRSGLREESAQVRRDSSIFAKYVREVGESEPAWRERIKTQAEAEQIRQENEDSDVYLKRILELKSDVPSLLPKFFDIACDVFGLRKPSEEDLAKVSYLDLKRIYL